MKKLNLLTRAEMKEVIGALAADDSGEGIPGICYIKVETRWATYYHEALFSGTCSAQQNQANSQCLTQLRSAEGAHCYYDCECDKINSKWAKNLA